MPGQGCSLKAPHQINVNISTGGFLPPPKHSFNTIHCYLPSWDSLKHILYFPAPFHKYCWPDALQDMWGYFLSQVRMDDHRIFPACRWSSLFECRLHCIFLKVLGTLKLLLCSRQWLRDAWILEVILTLNVFTQRHCCFSLQKHYIAIDIINNPCKFLI